MGCDTIISYLPGNFDVSTTVDDDVLYVGLRPGRICRVERIITTHDAVRDILKQLFEYPLKRFKSVDGEQRYLKCRNVIASDCADLQETKDITDTERATQITSQCNHYCVRVGSPEDNKKCTLRRVHHALCVLPSPDPITPVPG